MAAPSRYSLINSILLHVINSPNPGFPYTIPLDLTDARDSRRDRVNIVNSATDIVLQIDGSPETVDSVLDEFFGGNPHLPASNESIQALKNVEVKEGDPCVICFEEFKGGDACKEMPCKHFFHGECVSKWLKIHGTCPVCRFQMPVAAAHNFRAYWTEYGNRVFWVSYRFGAVADRTPGSGSPSAASSSASEGGSGSPSEE